MDNLDEDEGLFKLVFAMSYVGNLNIQDRKAI
jgi:hypothetical protein